MAEYPGDIIPVPSYQEGAFTTDEELLYSTNGGFTQKGVTLKPGQGVLPLGTILAKETASKKYVKYNNAGSGGAEVAVGILRKTVDTGATADAPGRQANIVIAGILNLTYVQAANSGALLTNGITALGARTSAALGTFTF